MDKKSAPIKGLIFRELYLGRNSYSSMLLLGVVGCIFLLLVVLSCKYGNLAAEIKPEEIPNMATTALGCMGVIFTLMGAMCCETANNDFITKWQQFLYASPVSEKKYMAVKFAITVATLLLAIVITALSGVIISAVTGVTFSDTAIAGIVCAMSIMAVSDVLLICLTYKLRSMSAAIIWYGVILLVVFVGGLFALFMFSEDPRRIEDTLAPLALGAAPFAPIAVAAAIVGGYFYCVKTLQRREK